MKKITRAVLSIVVLSTVTGCQDFKFGDAFLDKAPGSEVDIDVIYSNASYARRALWAAYETLPFPLCFSAYDYNVQLKGDILECLTDLNNSGLDRADCGATLYYSGNYNADAENEHHGVKYSYIGLNATCWLGIRRSWQFIENIDRVPDMSEEEKSRLKGEAKMIIAIHYSDLFRHFGGVQIVDHTYSPDEPNRIPRATAMKTLEFIVKLFDEAAEVLPWTVPEAESSMWDGRLTKAGALGLKARILLFAASPLFNSDAPYMAGEASENRLTWFGGYDKGLWDRAYDAHKAFFDELSASGGYKLVMPGEVSGVIKYPKPVDPEMLKLREAYRYGYLYRHNGEIIVSIRHPKGVSRVNNFWMHDYGWLQYAGDFGCVEPTQELVDMFPMKNGKAITDPSSGFNQQAPYENRDPRLYETVVVNDKDYYGRKAQIYPGGKDYQSPTGAYGVWKSGYRLRKFLLDGGGAVQYETPLELMGWEIHFPLLRLSELYLGFAEAAYQAGHGLEEAESYINIVRNRVGVGDIQGLDDSNFVDAILTERVCELSFEYVRWFDMIRYKREDIFKKGLHIMETVKNPDGTFTYSVVPDPAADRYWKNNFSPKWYLSAIPTNEIRKFEGLLIQNPGW